MCAVSMIHDYGYRQWPIGKPILEPKLPSQQELDEFKKLLEAAREFDRKTKQEDCVDPEKEKWLNELEELMNRRPK